MAGMLELYGSLSRDLADALSQLRAAASQADRLRESLAAAQSAVSPALTAREKELQDLLGQVRGFASAAAHYTPYRPGTVPPQAPDLKRLRDLDLRIDNTQTNDPNARELLHACAGAQAYLEAELRRLMQSMRAEQERRYQTLSAQGRQSIDAAQKQALAKLESVLSDGRLAALAKLARSESAAFFIDPQREYDPAVPKADAPVHRIGVTHRPFPVPKQSQGRISALFGDYYDPQRGELLLPFGLRANRPIKLRLRMTTAAQANLSVILSGMLFNILRNFKPAANKVVLLDPVARDPAWLGALQPLVGNPGFVRFSSGSEEDLALLRQLDAPGDGQTRYLVLRGFPDYFSSAARDLIRRLCANIKVRNLVIVTVENPSTASQTDAKDEAALQGACLIEADGSGTFLTMPGSAEKLRFSWYAGPRRLSDQAADRFRKAYTPPPPSMRYSESCPFPAAVPGPKGTARKGISVPIGKDPDGRLTELRFDDINPFAFLMGSAGSGKSSLLHVIISGLITRYHPDDIELWLADFNRVGFMQYNDILPPHLRYLLLDTSPLYCYSFIDQLTKEYERRQKVFAKHGWDNIKDIPPEYYMPIVFVILDEFDVMSEAIKEQEHYKILLQQIISKGRKFGFRILFSTQKYTSGSSGLTQTARINITTRLAMYAPDQVELAETISVPKLRDSEKEALRQIRPFHVMYKCADLQSGYRLTYVSDLYLDGSDTKKRDAWVHGLRKAMRPGSTYSPSDLTGYLDKKPVSITGVSSASFRQCAPLYQQAIRAHSGQFSAQPGDMLFFWGNLCSFDRVAPMILCRDEYQNALMLCRYLGTNQERLADTMASAVRSAGLQGTACEVWALPNELCITKRADYWTTARVFTDIKTLPAHIHTLRQAVDSGTAKPCVILAFQLPKLMRRLLHEQNAASGAGAPAPSGFGGGSMPTGFGGGGDPVAFILGKQAAAEKEDFNLQDDLQVLLQWGPAADVHLIVHAADFKELKTIGLSEKEFPHILAFRMGTQESYETMEGYGKQAAHLPEGVFLYTDRQEIRMFAPHSPSP